MLGSLRGLAATQLGQRTLIEVDGVGYWVYTGSWQPSGEVLCYLYHHTREDINDLYGFAEISGLELFESLLSVSGIGPKAALSILALGSADQIARAINYGDNAFLALAQGIGKRAAEKIILDLKGKLTVNSSETAEEMSKSSADLVAVLETLGYKPPQYAPLVAKLPPELTTVDDQIRWLLQQLG